MLAAETAGWESPPAEVSASEGEVHAWLIELDRDQDAVARLRTNLIESELEQAGRFRFERDRRRFTVARAALRDVLGRYLGIPARSVEFGYRDHGKPELPGFPELAFNLSHAGERGLLGVTARREIGVDIEELRELSDFDDMARHFFSASEVTALLGLQGPDKVRGFFNCWTRKEGYIKALGEGLSHPLDTFAVSLLPGDPAALLSVDGEPDAPSRWRLLSITPEPGYVACFVVDGGSWQLRRWRWRA